MSEFILHPTLEKDTITLGNLELCRVLLMNEQQFPWLILVPRRTELTELYQLDEDEQQQALRESVLISELIMHYFKGDKLNTGALGNLVPQLHLHHIVRFKNDPAWPNPVWGNFRARPYSNKDCLKLTKTLQHLIKGKEPTFIITD